MTPIKTVKIIISRFAKIWTYFPFRVYIITDGTIFPWRVQEYRMGQMNGTVWKNCAYEPFSLNHMNNTEPCRMNGTIWKKQCVWNGSYKALIVQTFFEWFNFFKWLTSDLNWSPNSEWPESLLYTGIHRYLLGTSSC